MSAIATILFLTMINCVFASGNIRLRFQSREEIQLLICIDQKSHECQISPFQVFLEKGERKTIQFPIDRTWNESRIISFSLYGSLGTPLGYIKMSPFLDAIPSKSLPVGRHFFFVAYNIVCNPGFFGKLCDVYCEETEGRRCLNNGIGICRNGWNGDDCNIRSKEENKNEYNIYGTHLFIANLLLVAMLMIGSLFILIIVIYLRRKKLIADRLSPPVDRYTKNLTRETTTKPCPSNIYSIPVAYSTMANNKMDIYTGQNDDNSILEKRYSSIPDKLPQIFSNHGSIV